MLERGILVVGRYWHIYIYIRIMCEPNDVTFDLALFETEPARPLGE